MITNFEYMKMLKYPHMSVQDTAIWERFMAKYPKAYSLCQYDFHIGDGPPFNPLMDNGDDLNQDMLYRLRIDVVGHLNGNNDIIELKPNAGVSTIGQVQSYKELFIRDGYKTGKVQAVIITDRLQPNMDYLCKQAGVILIIV